MVDSLASGGDLSLAVDEAVSEVPELFRSVGAAVTKPVENAATPSVPKVKGLYVLLKTKTTNVIESNTPPVVLKVLGGVHTWWTNDRLRSVVQGSVPGRETDTLVVQGSSKLSEHVRMYK